MNFFVISLKKNFFTLFSIIFLISLICFSSTNMYAAKEGLYLWATAVIPSLFPFFIATELICRTNFINIVGKYLNKVMKPIFNVPGESISALLLGIISGYPVGAKIVCNLKSKKIISRVEAERLISFTNNSGPLFILGSVGIALFKNSKIGVVLLISHILSCILVGIIFRNWKKDEIKIDYSVFEEKQNKMIKISDIGEILGDAVKSAITTILTIGGFVVFFSVVLSILQNSGIVDFIANVFYLAKIPKEFTKAFLCGIVELTNGVSLSCKLENTLSSILLTSFLLGFGGISVLFQVYSIIAKEKISIKPYIYGKFLQGIISCIFTLLLII